MSYVDAVLPPGKVIKHRGGLHWIIYVQGLVLLSIALPVLIAAMAGTFPALVWLAAALAFTGAMLMLKAWFEKLIVEIAVTDRRVIYKRRLIQRRTR